MLIIQRQLLTASTTILSANCALFLCLCLLDRNRNKKQLTRINLQQNKTGYQLATAQQNQKEKLAQN
jgi:hypothetical protein